MRNCILEFVGKGGKKWMFNVNGKDTFLLTFGSATDIGSAVMKEAGSELIGFIVYRYENGKPSQVYPRLDT